MESTLFTTLNASEEANISGGTTKAKKKEERVKKAFALLAQFNKQSANGGAGGAGGNGGNGGDGGTIVIVNSVVKGSVSANGGAAGDGGDGGDGGKGGTNIAKF